MMYSRASKLAKSTSVDGRNDEIKLHTVTSILNLKKFSETSPDINSGDDFDNGFTPPMRKPPEFTIPPLDISPSRARKIAEAIEARREFERANVREMNETNDFSILDKDWDPEEFERAEQDKKIKEAISFEQRRENSCIEAENIKKELAQIGAARDRLMWLYSQVTKTK